MAAVTYTIGGNGTLFVGEDKTFRIEVLTIEFDENGVPIAPSSSSVPVDISGWDIRFDVRKTDKAPDPAIFSKTAAITGVYNASRALNTQRAVVSLTDTELNTVTARTYRHSWKRMDDGVETVLSRGDFVVEKATAP